VDLIHRCGPRSTLRQGCAEALLRLGYPASRLTEPVRYQSILVLDPSGFFRKRILGALQGRSVREAQERGGAELLLQEAPVDLLISEASDSAGSLQEWFATQWRARLVGQVLLSSASRSDLALQDRPWLAGALYKPYPMEELLALLPE
jgi:hypothetical protein